MVINVCLYTSLYYQRNPIKNIKTNILSIYLNLYWINLCIIMDCQRGLLFWDWYLPLNDAFCRYGPIWEGGRWEWKTQEGWLWRRTTLKRIGWRWIAEETDRRPSLQRDNDYCIWLGWWGELVNPPFWQLLFIHKIEMIIFVL